MEERNLHGALIAAVLQLQSQWLGIDESSHLDRARLYLIGAVEAERHRDAGGVERRVDGLAHDLIALHRRSLLVGQKPLACADVDAFSTDLHLQLMELRIHLILRKIKAERIANLGIVNRPPDRAHNVIGVIKRLATRAAGDHLHSAVILESDG